MAIERFSTLVNTAYEKIRNRDRAGCKIIQTEIDTFFSMCQNNFGYRGVAELYDIQDDIGNNKLSYYRREFLENIFRNLKYPKLSLHGNSEQENLFLVLEEVYTLVDNLNKNGLAIDFQTEIVDRLPSFGINMLDILPKRITIHQDTNTTSAALGVIEIYKKYGIDPVTVDFEVTDGQVEEICENFKKNYKDPNYLELIKVFVRKESYEKIVKIMIAKSERDLKTLSLLVQDLEFQRNIIELNEIVDKDYILELFDLLKQIQDLPENVKNMILLTEKVQNCESAEMGRILQTLIPQIVTSSDPVSLVERVIGVFEKNHIPTIAKYFILFNELYPPDVLQSKIGQHTTPSLRDANDYRRRLILWTDFLKANIFSSNSDLLNYLRNIQNTEPLLEKLESNSELNHEEVEAVNDLFNKLQIIYPQTTLAKREKTQTINDFESSINLRWQWLKASFKIRNGQKLTERLLDMFAHPLGLRSLDEVVDIAKNKKQEADIRNRNSENLEPVVNKGCLIKGLDSINLELILDRGIVCREFIGGENIGSDSTPLDTDTIKAGQKKEIKDWDTSINQGYGDIVVVIEDRGQFFTANNQQTNSSLKYHNDKYELIHTPVVDQNHYGIRGGIASIEISKIILMEAVEKSSKKEQIIQNIFYQIAKKGFYIPVFSSKGDLIFSPKDFEKYRQIFGGIARFDGPKLAIKKSINSGAQNILKTVLEEQNLNLEKLEKIKVIIYRKIESIFKEFNILKQSNDNYLGFELYDSGSTGRGTFLPPIGDFDYIVRLCNSDFKKVDIIIDRICQEFCLQKQDVIVHKSGKSGLQLRMNNVSPKIISQELDQESPIEIDIGFYPKSKMDIYFSHQAVEERLEIIEKEFGSGIKKM
jgi:hypothetical protein